MYKNIVLSIGLALAGFFSNQVHPAATCAVPSKTTAKTSAAAKTALASIIEQASRQRESMPAAQGAATAAPEQSSGLPLAIRATTAASAAQAQAFGATSVVPSVPAQVVVMHPNTRNWLIKAFGVVPACEDAAMRSLKARMSSPSAVGTRFLTFARFGKCKKQSSALRSEKEAEARNETEAATAANPGTALRTSVHGARTVVSFSNIPLAAVRSTLNAAGFQEGDYQPSDRQKTVSALRGHTSRDQGVHDIVGNMIKKSLFLAIKNGVDGPS
ncbi:MAG TPA: hypothetical protein VLG71_02695, partial [Candidatus Limnocylindria bacterium]|nr:hypothetical protein [Candidatus Limnocylindria bacterium]